MFNINFSNPHCIYIYINDIYFTCYTRILLAESLGPLLWLYKYLMACSRLIDSTLILVVIRSASICLHLEMFSNLQLKRIDS